MVFYFSLQICGYSRGLVPPAPEVECVEWAGQVQVPASDGPDTVIIIQY